MVREKQAKRITGSDTPPIVEHRLSPQEGRISGLRSYQTSERKRETAKPKKLSWVVGSESSGELVIAPTLWASWLAWMKAKCFKDGYVLLQDGIYESARELKEKWGFGSSVTTRRYLKEATGQGLEWKSGMDSQVLGEDGETIGKTGLDPVTGFYRLFNLKQRA